MSYQKTGTFTYSGTDVPPGGNEGDVLTKVSGPNYYCAWRPVVVDTGGAATLDSIFDDGEY
jgi:hypothetical protein